MKPNEIKVGSTYYTRISGDVGTLVKVIADHANGAKRYQIQRTDTGAILSKLRGAGELHEKPGPWGVAHAALSVIPAAVRTAFESVPPPPPVAEVKRGPGRPRKNPPSGPQLISIPGPAKTKVATMSAPSQTQLLAHLASLPPASRQFLKDLIDAVDAPSPTVQTATPHRSQA